LHFHHDKHHAAYVKALNACLEAKGDTLPNLEEVITEAARSSERKLFNNAAQAWNHSFFWAAMSPQIGQPEGELASAIEAAFGNLDGLKQAFVSEGVGHFGSGWVWLASDRDGALVVRSTHDADDTLTHPDLMPLLVCDLWEHAYYLDHQNDRQGFLEAWVNVLPNWPFAAIQYRAAKGRGDPWRHPEAVAEADLTSAADGTSGDTETTMMVRVAEVVKEELEALRKQERERAGVGEGSHMGGAGTQSGQTDFANP
jgi:Fe-Mn family superoxide dismutase